MCDDTISIQFNYNVNYGKDINMYHFTKPVFQFKIENNIFQTDDNIKLSVDTSIRPELQISQFNFEKKINLNLSNIDELLNLYFVYLYYPEENFYPELKSVNFNFLVNNSNKNFKIENFGFKDLIFFAADDSLQNLMVRNQDNVVIAYKGLLKNKYKISRLKTSYIGLAKFKVFANDKLTPLTGANFNITNTFDEPIYNLVVDGNGNAVNKYINDILLFDNSADKPYYIEIFNQRQKIQETNFTLSAKKHLQETEFRIITEQNPLNQEINKKFNLKGKALVKDNAGNLYPLKYYKIKLYDENVGLVEIYSKDFEQNFIAATVTNENGEFEFKNILNKGSSLKATLDTILILELETEYSQMLNSALGTDIIYRTKIFFQKNIWPFKGEFNTGDLIVDSSNKEYDKIMIFEEINKAYLKYKKNIVSSGPKLSVIYPYLPVKNFGSQEIEFNKSANTIKLSRTAGANILKLGAASKYLLLY